MLAGISFVVAMFQLCIEDKYILWAETRGRIRDNNNNSNDDNNDNKSNNNKSKATAFMSVSMSNLKSQSHVFIYITTPRPFPFSLYAQFLAIYLEAIAVIESCFHDDKLLHVSVGTGLVGAPFTNMN